MKNLTKKGFTLVELIVVITILAILGTIAFLNFGQYTDEARDTKVKSDIKNIIQKISADTNAGKKKYDDFLSQSGAFEVTGTVNSGATIGSGGVFYKAGTINYEQGGIKKADFQFKDKDGNDQPYVFGYVINKDFSTFEVAGNVFDKAGNPTVVSQGTYYKVDSSDVPALIKTKEGNFAVDGTGGTLY